VNFYPLQSYLNIVALIYVVSSLSAKRPGNIHPL